jgi:hypothetical protein
VGSGAHVDALSQIQRTAKELAALAHGVKLPASKGNPAVPTGTKETYYTTKETYFMTKIPTIRETQLSPLVQILKSQSSIVALYSRHTRLLTFENLSQEMRQ